MHTPPDEVTVGGRYTQEEIEKAFETGFGYQISGINPRRDRTGSRYVLLFANEEGPYDDSVTAGRFEYVGEGLSGDQDESSPGNSVLVDAISSSVPVHFFYKQSERVIEPLVASQSRLEFTDPVTFFELKCCLKIGPMRRLRRANTEKCCRQPQTACKV